jgi:hypothetical protein
MLLDTPGRPPSSAAAALSDAMSVSGGSRAPASERMPLTMNIDTVGTPVCFFKWITMRTVPNFGTPDLFDFYRTSKKDLSIHLYGSSL